MRGITLIQGLWFASLIECLFHTTIGAIKKGTKMYDATGGVIAKS